MRHLGHENGRHEHVILTGDLRAPVGHGITDLPGDSSVTAKTLHHFTVIYSKLQLFTLAVFDMITMEKKGRGILF